LTHVWTRTNVKDETLSKDQFFKALANYLNCESCEGMIEAVNYYEIASETYQSLKSQEPEDIRNALIFIVAKVINKNLNLDNVKFAEALENIFKDLVENKKEFVTEEGFAVLVRANLGDQFFDGRESELIHSCKEFYTFARTFIILTHVVPGKPSINAKLIRNFVWDKAFEGSEYALDFVDLKINSIMKYFAIESKDLPHSLTLFNKGQTIIYKLYYVLEHFYGKAITYVANSNVYTTADTYLDLTTKLQYAQKKALEGATYAREQILAPGLKYVEGKRDEVIVLIKGLNKDSLQKYQKILVEKFDFLKRCSIVMYRETIQLKMDKDALNGYYKDLRAEVLALYNEVKSFEKVKIVSAGNDLYKRALAKVKSIQEAADKLNENNANNRVEESQATTAINNEGEQQQQEEQDNEEASQLDNQKGERTH